ncbi:MAG TPA: ABC transporter ATP-binding protein [Patescibacteria group bacterium]|nr:ABC transporter ATP-binding protein [Patescibacteria group bacterium]
MDNNTAIKVENVYKDFVLPHEKRTSVKSAVTGLFKKRNKGSELQHALQDISFEIKKGEFFGIVGRNGSGKSTMLKILAGIYQPTKGKVAVQGKLVPFIELGVGFNPELTGRENVFLNGALLGFSKKQVSDMYDEIVQFAELERFMDQKLKNYSSGMQVRLAFSLAVRAEADILLVDEVLAVGDADFQRKCFDYFRKLKRNNKTVVFVSHDMSAVREYCDRAIFIEKSELILEGSANKIATAYTKIFTPKDESNEGKEGGRWGDGGMRQTKVTITPKVCKQEDQELTLRIDYEANTDVHNPVFGLLIKNATGAHILGTNTKIKLMDTGSYKKGDKGSLEWRMPNIFNDGEYFITVAISHEDAVTQHDWIEDAVRFRVYREDRTAFVVNPFIDAKLTK